jgi:hypothetical protein
MSNSESSGQSKPSRGVRRIPENSFLYDRVVPFALLAMAVLLVLVVLAALLILLGAVRF